MSRSKARGRVALRKPIVLPVPKSGIRYYLLTSAQNNTPVHASFWRNLLAYKDYLGAALMVSRFTYDKARWSSTRKTKNGDRRDSSLWYDPKIQPYVCDEGEYARYQLAPTLHWCAETERLPTAVRPLAGRETYTGAASGIFPHAKLALQSVPTCPGSRTKMNYTTGACTQLNYVQRGAGQLAEHHHAYAALIVEVTPDGRWWVRQLSAMSSTGAFQDLTVRVSGGKIHEGAKIKTFAPGDIHAAEIDPRIEKMTWGPDGIVDRLRPDHQFLHDLFSFSNGAGHHCKTFDCKVRASASSYPTVAAECDATAAFLGKAARPWCDTVVVASNHDTHPERWLDEGDYRSDLVNAEVFLEATLARLRAAERGARWAFLPWAMGARKVPPTVRFLTVRDSVMIDGIEYAMHGHLGANGARGSASGFDRVVSRCTVGHAHSAEIRNGVFQSGVCQLNMAYAKGPSGWSETHTIGYRGGKRAMITVWDGDPWAGFSDEGA